MAIIYSYTLTAPKPKDIILGTVTLDETSTVPVYGNPTVNFSVQSVIDLVATGIGAQSLQQVTNVGATTSNVTTFESDIKVDGRFFDSAGQVGTTGQLLSSTVVGTSWISDNAGLNYFVTGASYTTGTLTLTRNGGLGSLTATGFLQVGTTATDALAGNTTTITAAQATAITANTAKVGITAAQATAITANTAKISDTGVPAILSDGSLPSLNTGITGAEVRTLIGAGTASAGVDEEVILTSGVATLTKTITIPAGATSTGVNGFSGEGITSLVLPTSLLVIGVDSFKDNKIASLSLPNNLTTIGNNSFNDNLLTGTLAIPASVTSIGTSSFAGNSIQTLTFTGTSTLPTIGSGAFSNNALVSLVIPPSVTSIGSDAFTNQSNAAGATLTSISFSSTAMTINAEAFQGNTALPTITIPNNYILNGGVFDSCSGVTSVNLGTGVTLNDGTFSGLTSLTTITFPTGTIITGGSLLQQCTSLQTINFTDAPTTIPSAFAFLCTSFTGGTNLFNAASATFASSITTFKSSCFNSVQLPTTVNFTVVAVFENDCFASTAITTVNAKTGSSIASNAFPIGTTINLT